MSATLSDGVILFPVRSALLPMLRFHTHVSSSVVPTRWQLQSVVDMSVVDGTGSSHVLERWTLGISPVLSLADAGLLAYVDAQVSNLKH